MMAQISFIGNNISLISALNHIYDVEYTNIPPVRMGWLPYVPSSLIDSREGRTSED